MGRATGQTGLVSPDSLQQKKPCSELNRDYYVHDVKAPDQRGSSSFDELGPQGGFQNFSWNPRLESVLHPPHDSMIPWMIFRLNSWFIYLN